MTVHTFNYSNCNSCGIDRIIDTISVCIELLVIVYAHRYPLIISYNNLFLSPDMMNMSSRILVSIML